MITVSVIIPNYNHAPFLPQRIESVINQTFQGFELIILDDCSTDKSREVIELYRHHPKVSHVIYNTQNSGSTFRQWQKGIKLAKGEWIWIAESDDWCDTRFLETLTQKLADEKVSIAYCRTISVTENDQQNQYQWGEAIQPEIWAADQTFEGKEFIASFLKYRNIIPNASAVLFAKKYFTEADEVQQMRYTGDWFLWIVIASKGNVAYSSKALNYFRRHAASTRFMRSFDEERIRMQEYLRSIKKACSVASSGFSAFDKKYNWILDQWMERVSIFGIKKSLLSRYPLLFKVNAYYRLLISKI